MKIRELTAERLQRIEEDFYPTPEWMVDILMDDLINRSLGVHNLRGRLVEPCVGEGHIVRASWPHLLIGTQWITNDIDPKHEAQTHLDATDPDYWYTRGLYDWCITNPPFDESFDIIRHAYDYADMGVIALLRLSWLEPTKERGMWLAEHPPRRTIVMRRWSFRRNGSTDNVTAAWFIWTKRDIVQPGTRVVPSMGVQEGLT